MRLKTILKLAISAMLIVQLARTVELVEFKRLIGQVSPGWLAVVILGYLAGQCISSVKWWLLVSGQVAENLPFVKAFHAYFTGMFVNVLGVGTVGGDMTRAILISRGSSNKTIAASSVVADRLHGLWVLTLIGITSTLLFRSDIFQSSADLSGPLQRQGQMAASLSSPLPDIVWYGFLLGAVGAVAGWFIGPWLLVKLTPKNSKLHSFSVQISRAFPRSLGRLGVLTLMSLIFHSLQISLHQAMACALGIKISWAMLFLSVPFVNIMSSLPITWQGLGIRENGLAFFLVPSALSREQAIAMGIIWLMAITFSGLVGGLVSLFLKNRTTQAPLLASKEEQEPFAEILEASR